jgi:hypothetical protein
VVPIWDNRHLFSKNLINGILLGGILLVSVFLSVNLWKYGIKERRLCQFHLASFYILSLCLIGCSIADSVIDFELNDKINQLMKTATEEANPNSGTIE